MENNLKEESDKKNQNEGNENSKETQTPLDYLAQQLLTLNKYMTEGVLISLGPQHLYLRECDFACLKNDKQIKVVDPRAPRGLSLYVHKSFPTPSLNPLKRRSTISRKQNKKSKIENKPIDESAALHTHDEPVVMRKLKQLNDVTKKRKREKKVKFTDVAVENTDSESDCTEVKPDEDVKRNEDDLWSCIKDCIQC